MLLELEKRPQRSSAMALLSPLIAVALTVITAGVLLALVGIPPLQGLKVYFVDPLTNVWSLEELTVKASPLIIIAIGLSMCFLANTWNIGAEGQYILGAIAGGWVALTFGPDGGWWVLPAMIVAGILGGAVYALIPAVLKVVFKANEILTSLMLVYVAQLLIDYLVRGPWRDPMGFNFPQTATFDEAATLPLLDPGGRMHLGVLITLVIVIAAAILLSRTLKGFEIRLVGQAPRAARFAGFDDKRLILLTFAISGGLAGLAGLLEVAGPIGQLLPTISPGYGFTAIIVAFLGRLNPIGILVAGLALGLSFLGGEQAQISLGVPLDLTNVVQGTLLFYVLACDTLILYRVRVRSTGGRAVRGVH
ncbi:ABC transporter permease [Segnochrobactrum spirostomi]|uniref:ABC transporter permease n=1 Tax=Segnochrobactrum spirostomi TaxID=2608987 RepID=A0A6A7Y5W8_9HYPH|nr:ABC transporter permease [Segnochrobactrum spirostomi]MQT14176.1 ABC transporter permease [Segnochrobactrum spirostomi]